MCEDSSGAGGVGRRAEIKAIVDARQLESYKRVAWMMRLSHRTLPPAWLVTRVSRLQTAVEGGWADGGDCPGTSEEGVSGGGGSG